MHNLVYLGNEKPADHVSAGGRQCRLRITKHDVQRATQEPEGPTTDFHLCTQWQEEEEFFSFKNLEKMKIMKEG